MKEKDASSEGQDILMRLHSDAVPSSWRVFRISRKKLAALIFRFCSFIGLCMGFLAIYLFGNFDHHPPVPPSATHTILMIMSVFLVSALLLSMGIWITMKNIVLVLTFEGVIRGDGEKPNKTFYMAYQDIVEIYVDGNVILIQGKGDTGRKKKVDCRWFDAPTQEVASSLLTAYEDFKTSQAHRKPKRV